MKFMLKEYIVVDSSERFSEYCLLNWPEILHTTKIVVVGNILDVL